MPLIECPECRGKVSELAPQCPQCGYPVSQLSKCPECATLIEPARDACANCGFPVRAITGPVRAQSSNAPPSVPLSVGTGDTQIRYPPASAPRDGRKRPETSIVNVTIQKPQGSIIAAIFVMFFVSLLLFWLPVLGPLIAGIAGGKKAGGIAGAVLAVFLPGLVFGFLLFTVVSYVTTIPLLGAIAGLGGVLLALLQIGPLLLGAIIGGALA
jgi:hypothetical protein